MQQMSPTENYERPQEQLSSSLSTGESSTDTAMTCILIIEDNAPEVELVKTYLQEARDVSFSIVSAPRLAEGLDLLSQVKVDLILLDLSLPDSHGFETFADLYTEANQIPIIILTGLDDHELAIKAVRAGAQDYLIKDEVTRNLLVHAIRYAIERKQTQEALKKRNQELAVLNTIVKDINQPLRTEKVLSRVLVNILTLDLFGPRGGSGCIFLKDEKADTLRMAASKGMREGLKCMNRAVKFGECYCGKAAAQGKMVISDLNVDRETLAQQGLPYDYRVLCIPLKASGDVIGVMNLWLPLRREITKDQIDLLRAISEQITSAVQKAQLYETTQQRMIELDTLNRTSQAISAVLNVDEVLETINDEVRAMLHAEAVSVLLHEPGSEELVFAVTSGPNAEQLKGRRMPDDQGIAGWVMQAWQAIRVDNAQGDPRHCKAIDEMLNATTQNLIAVPMTTRGKIIGIIEAINRDQPFTRHEMELVRTLAGSAAIAIENARFYEAEREQRKIAEQSRDQLMHNQRLAATGELTASLAHEINNPLQAIHNSLQLLLSFPLSPEEQQSYIEMADEEIERLITMVKRILDFSRRPQEDMQPLQVNYVVKKVLNLANKYLQHKKISLKSSFATDLAPVQGNATTLGQVFLNLIINAVEAMPEGGTLTVTTTSTPDECVAVRISDTGPGIPCEVRSHIFEPFFSTKAEGTGLGLSISQSIVQQHNGEIQVKSRPDEGTTFTVILPMASAPQ